MIEPDGADKAHYACFLPKNWQGEGPVVNFLIPECELQADLPRPPGAEPAVFINMPPVDRQKVENWLPLACKIATRQAAALYFACDTAKQAEQAARMASPHLPDHERVALERMYEPHTSARSGLH
jgi:hypothetical protein